MATKQDWVFLRDALRSIDNRMAQMSGAWELPDELSGQKARDYLEAANVRLLEAEKTVKHALDSPLQRVQEAGRDLGSVVRAGAERAAAIAKDSANDLVATFEGTVERMANAGVDTAKSFGMGAAAVLLIALLLFLRK